MPVCLFITGRFTRSVFIWVCWKAKYDQTSCDRFGMLPEVTTIKSGSTSFPPTSPRSTATWAPGGGAERPAATRFPEPPSAAPRSSMLHPDIGVTGLLPSITGYGDVPPRPLPPQVGARRHLESGLPFMLFFDRYQLLDVLLVWPASMARICSRRVLFSLRCSDSSRSLSSSARSRCRVLPAKTAWRAFSRGGRNRICSGRYRLRTENTRWIVRGIRSLAREICSRHTPTVVNSYGQLRIQPDHTRISPGFESG